MTPEGLNRLFLGKAKWSVERSSNERVSIVSFQCDRRTPVIRINERVFEDAMDPSMLLASKCIDLYTNHHRIVHPFEAQPTLTCGECRSPVDMPTDDELHDFEFCERQSVLWAERAMNAKR